jgi:hypothetical protein
MFECLARVHQVVSGIGKGDHIGIFEYYRDSWAGLKVDPGVVASKHVNDFSIRTIEISGADFDDPQ